MVRRRGACAKLRASREVLRHAPRGESTGTGSGLVT